MHDLEWGGTRRLFTYDRRCYKGPSDAQLNMQNQLSQQQLTLGQQEQAQSQQQYQEYKQLTQPAITKYTALAGGDRNAAVAVAAPEIGAIASGYDAAKAQIMNTIPPGAARDRALADLELKKYSGTSSAFAAETQQAPDVLSNIGAGVGAFSLQQLGATLSGFSGASQSNTQAMSAENQAKANQVGLISGLAGAAGTGLGAFKLPSDQRLKENVHPLRNLLTRVGRFNLVQFDYVGGERQKIGAIAQEISDLFPQVVAPRPDGMLTVDYAALAAIALGAVAELSGKVASLERRLDQARYLARAV